MCYLCETARRNRERHAQRAQALAKQRAACKLHGQQPVTQAPACEPDAPRPAAPAQQ